MSGKKEEGNPGERTAGASRMDILFRFMVQAVCVSTLGGVLGLLAGWGFIEGIALYMGWRVLYAAHFAVLCVAGLVGVGFGIFPAWQAAGIDPAEAVRRE